MEGLPVTYEVNLVPDPSISAEFDIWLEEHVRDMLRLPGFVQATIRRAQDDDEVVRSVAYVLSDRAALDAYLRDYAARMRQHGIDRFGDRFRATRRILDAGETLTPTGLPVATCANCDADLRGQYCASCGQRARNRMISLWELIREASDVLTSLDSRLWRTLGLLMFRPGFLTEDYLLGRRARYIPPLRLFIGGSLLFFFLLAIGARYGLEGGMLSATGGEDEPGINFQINLDDDDVETPVASPSATADSDAEPSMADTDIESAGLPGTGGAVVGDAAVPTQLRVPPEADDSPDPSPDAAEAAGEHQAEGDENGCDDIQFEVPEGWSWVRRWLTEERLKATCLKITADGGGSFGVALLENIPFMMFVLLPVMAFVMKFAYPLSGRFYVEHLLFLVHFHAFFYLLLTINLIFEWGFEGTELPDWPSYALGIVTAIYVPVYLYRSMRLVYKQGAAATIAKYVALGFAYLAGFVILFVGTLAVTALTL